MNLSTFPGFHGLHPDKPVTFYWRHLPHWRQDDATYFITFRLGDSLPNSKLQELRAMRDAWESKHKPPHSKEEIASVQRHMFVKLEHWLDQGMGACRLKNCAAAALVANALRFHDNDRYALGCFVVMPNHVHAVVRPISRELERILQLWKSYSSIELNKLAGTKGAVWQHESFDHIIRDEDQLYRIIRYIRDNPTRAGLSREQCLFWLRPEWEAMGLTFE